MKGTSQRMRAPRGLSIVGVAQWFGRFRDAPSCPSPACLVRIALGTGPWAAWERVRGRAHLRRCPACATAVLHLRRSASESDPSDFR